MHLADRALLLALLLLPCSTLQAEPDLSTPQAAARSFAAIYLPRFYEVTPLDVQLDENDLIGREQFTQDGWEQVKRVVAENKDTRERTRTLHWSFSLGKVIRRGDRAEAHVWVAQRRNQFDYGTKTIKVIHKRIEHVFSLRRVGGRWLVERVRRTCYACGGTGRCPFCAGTGKRLGKACTECDGTGVCKTCNGKKLISEDLASSFERGVLAPPPGPYAAGDLSTPRAAAEGYLRLRARKQLVLGAARKKHFVETLARWRPYFVPRLVRTWEQNLAKSEADAEKRQEEWKAIARVTRIDRPSDTKAYAIVEYSLPGERGQPATAIPFRLVLRKVGARWLIDQLQTRCYSCKGTRICKYCSGSGKVPNTDRVCPSCHGTGACNACQGTGWIESTLFP